MHRKSGLFLAVMSTWALVFMQSSLFAGVKLENVLRQKKDVSSIVISPNATPEEKFAAKEVAKYLKQISGEEIPVVSFCKKEESTGCIFIGLNSIPAGWKIREKVGWSIGAATLSLPAMPWRSLVPIATLHEEGFFIRTIENSIVVVGREPRGTLYGVYSLLEKTGCRWWPDGVELVPETSDLCLPYFWERQSPKFERREIAIKGTEETPEWFVKSKLNSVYPRVATIQAFEENYGGLYWRLSVGGHSLTALISADEYFEKHPEYFALRKTKEGKWKRDSSQVCPSNEELIQIIAEKIIQYFEANPKNDVFPMALADNNNYCQCEKCRKFENHSDHVLYLINHVIALVEKKFPDKRFCTYAYGPTWTPPATVIPNKKLTIEFCTHYPFSQLQGIGDVTLAINQLARNNYAGWRGVTDNIHAYMYVVDFRYLMLPVPIIDSSIENAKWYYNAGTKGLKWQMEVWDLSRNITPLECYLMAKLSWDPMIDTDLCIQDFIDGYYGPAAKEMGKYYNTLSNLAKKGSFCIIIYRPNQRVLNKEFVKTELAVLAKAYQKTQENTIYRKRVDMQRLRILYLDLLLAPSENSLRQFESIIQKYNIPNWKIAEKKTHPDSYLYDFVKLCKKIMN